MDGLKDALKRLFREYQLISAAIIATLAAAVALGWVTIDNDDWPIVLGAITAWLLVLRFLSTPVNDPVLEPGTIVNESTSKYPTSVVVADEQEAVPANEV